MDLTLSRMASEANLSVDLCNYLAEVDAPARKSDEVVIRVAQAFKVQNAYVDAGLCIVHHMTLPEQ